MKVNICGQDYKIFYETDEEQPKFEACEAVGYLEPYAKEIHILRNDRDDKRLVKDVEKFEIKVLRHEIIHAILYECGITDYWENETIVDMLAMIFPKLEKSIAMATAQFHENLETGEHGDKNKVMDGE